MDMDADEDSKLPPKGGCGKRSVTWGTGSTQMFIPHVHDLEPEVVAAIWYQAEEYEAMSKADSTQVELVNDGLILEETVTLRGLEHLRSAEYARRNQLRNEACMAVLDEQWFQQDTGIQDPEAISQVYLESTKRAIINARELGEQDEMEVKMMNSDEKQAASPSSNMNDGPSRVTFRDTYSILPHLSMKDYSEEETLNSWFQRFEFKKIKADVKYTINLIKTNRAGTSTMNEEDDLCPRGLEHFLTRGSRHGQRRSIELTVTVVLDEQDEQDRRGRADPEKLAQISYETTWKRGQVAATRAEGDAVFTSRYLSSECLEWGVEFLSNGQSRGSFKYAPSSVKSCFANGQTGGEVKFRPSDHRRDSLTLKISSVAGRKAAPTASMDIPFKQIATIGGKSPNLAVATMARGAAFRTKRSMAVGGPRPRIPQMA